MNIILKTEQADIPVTSIDRYKDFVFVTIQNTRTLYRIISDEEKMEQAPDALLKTEEKIERLLFITSKFSNAKEAFHCMEENTKRLKDAMATLPTSSDEKSETKQQEMIPKVICYDYLFTYFGKDMFQDKEVGGAAISIAFRPRKDGKVVTFTEEPVVIIEQPSRLSEQPSRSRYWFSDLINVHFDKEIYVAFTTNPLIKQLFLETFGWDDISISIESYELDIKESEYVLAPQSVSKTDWENFLKNHIEDFDTTDNRNAQCTSYSFIEA